MKTKTSITVLMALTSITFGKVDLVTLPGRDMTQLTIYNSADLTLVRDGRSLTLKKGDNKLQFSWANTLIDPTSLSMQPTAHADKIDITDLTYPARVQNVGLWNIKSEIGGSVPVEITYLTSGLSWRAFYMGTLAKDEKTMRLEGYVVVSNNSGEDYENAQTRLIVGQVHMLDQIAELARRQYPYGRPGESFSDVSTLTAVPMPRMARKPLGGAGVMDALTAKEIKKEGLSEYFLYTIDGTETIPHTWSKRLPSFDADPIPVVNLYKFEEDRYGTAVIRYLSFKNDEDHKLGETPIPGGVLKVYRTVDAAQHLSYEGQSGFKYIPVGEDIELNLGAVSDVIVKPTLMDEKTDNYRFDEKGNINGWDEIRTFRLELKNTRALPVKIELKRNFPTPHWAVKNLSDAEKYYEKVDLDTVKYTLTLEPESETTIEYVLTFYQGVRTEDWTRMQRQ